ncbi:maestro heat-like repeat-containing protein family member 1 isoform X2 [Cephus cinctus]|uniref:Maestro heat-like repeat-containing protein family member 1 isoform X2 n=1 Tax=Cephus cinctus TaxID=211228 RepID=A0AAJ7RET3_CEPCN|nr:maestro heat-like repeat-containing protein family member 1 isoform X2 [Cephus cinctus]
MNEEVESNVVPELPAVIGALFDALDDKDENVKQEIIQSIKRIAKQNPVSVINTAVYFRELHRKISSEHVISMMKILVETCRDQSFSLQEDLASSVANLAIDELIGDANKEACELLVALSRFHNAQTIGILLSKFDPGTLPHYAIVEAMGKLAMGNTFGTVPFIKLAMSIMIPMMYQVRDDRLKQAFCYAFGRFAEAINDYLNNINEAPDPGITNDSFNSEISSVYDVLTHNWIRSSRDGNVIESVLTSIGPMLPLLPKEAEKRQTVKLIPMLLTICKRSHVRLAATRVLAMLLNNIIEEEKEVIKQFLESLHHTLSEFVSVNPFDVSREALLTHYETLQCFRAIVISYPDEGLDRILQQIKSPAVIHRSRALVVLRHLINTLPPQNDAVLQRIALTLQESLGEASARQMVGAIVALAARTSLPLLSSQRATFIRFLVAHCGSKSIEAEACEEALHLLATTVEGVEDWLWPLLLSALLDPNYSTSAISVVRALSPLATKLIRKRETTEIENNFPRAKVMVRCFELLGEEKNRISVVALLRCAAPLLGTQLKELWDKRLLEVTNLLEAEQDNNSLNVPQRALMWEERIVELLEESVIQEGETWAHDVADELALKASAPGMAPLLGAVSSNATHFTLLIELARTHSTNGEFARAVAIAAKRHLSVILKLMEDSCFMEDHRKIPVKLLGLVKDTKAAATAEAAKAGLMRCYAEMAHRTSAVEFFPAIEKHILPWTVRQLTECKELTTKESGLLALEQIGGAVHPNRLAGSTGLRARGPTLTTLLSLLQGHSGHRPLQLYPLILRATVSLSRIPPALSSDERAILLGTVVDKVIAASAEIGLLMLPDVMQQVVDGLGMVCSEVVADSADALAELVEIVMPWMQSKSSTERRTTLLTLRSTLRSYHDSLKYTYPSGKLEPGKLLGRILAWCADPESTLRPIVVDCVALSLSIGARHRSTLPDNNLDHDLSESKRIIVSEDSSALYKGIKNLAMAVSERVASGEVVGLAEGLIESLLCRGEGGLAAGIALTQHFNTRGADIPRADVYLIDNIVAQMRHMENTSCRRGAATAVRSLMKHHPQEVIEQLIRQPLPLDRGTEECWKELGNDQESGLQALELLLSRMENSNLYADVPPGTHTGKHNTVTFSSLAAVVATGHLLQCPNSEVLIEKKLSELLSILLTYLAGWLHAETPTLSSVTKFGFIPNRESCKINPHREVYCILTNILTVVDSDLASSLPNESIFESNSEAEESLVMTVRAAVRCLGNRSEVLSNLAHSVGKLSASTLPAQRAVSAAFYAELIGRVDCGAIWLDAIVNTLHEAKSDSSPLVRKLATIGLSRISCLQPEQIDEYFENCVAALLDGLEEPANGEGGSEVALESLRGLAGLLSLQREIPVSPRIVLALKPFVEKENAEVRLAAINSLGAIARGWSISVSTPNDDISDHLLGCLPCLIIKLEDPNPAVFQAVRETLYHSAKLLQCEPLAVLINGYYESKNNTGNATEEFLRQLIHCLQEELPQRAEELRNAVSRGYVRSENYTVRATSASILGLFGQPRPEDIQRLLQLLRDKECNIRSRAARALSLCFTQQ